MSDTFDIASAPQLAGSVDTGVVRIPPTQTAIEMAVGTYFADHPEMTGPAGPKGEPGDPGTPAYIQMFIWEEDD